MHSSRNLTIDILRGIAIFTMVAANLSASLLQPDDKVLIFRLYGTFAAPLFVMLAGMMVVITGTKHATFQHYLKRGLSIIVCGCLLDVLVWQIYPFLGYDILYLTGLSIPVVHLLSKYCTITTRTLIVILLIASTPALQTLFDYREELSSVEIAPLPFSDYLVLLLSEPTAQRFLLDGWFPLMPWLSVAITGSILGSLYRQGYSFASKRLLATGIALFCIGVALWLAQNPHLVIREGYSELFYPPTTGYLFTATGLIFIGFFCVETTQQLTLHSVFLKLGHASLFMYLFHQIVLVFILMPIEILNNQPLPTFLLTYLAVIAVMVAAGHLLASIKQKYKNLPFIVRFIIGS
ncbi:MAG: heparan-alpha-glucosaminide N-acetyltransferase domain-containing protein [Methylovulum sp.]|nr:heparan-alpha-glucosaminide N-acetyltransferase domain-containing protein [Methylovulum sp.]